MKQLFVLLVLLLLINSNIPAKASNTDTIAFKALSEGFLLDARIVKKAGHNEKRPAIVFLTGSGDFSTIENYKTFTGFFIDEPFLDQGFAIVYFDKRGLGESEGVWYETTFEQRALDAVSVVLEIHNFHFIDKEKIFLAGHSQGGWIAQIALALHPELFAGAVSIAGPTFSVREQMLNDYKSDFICNKGLNEAKALVRAQRKLERDMFLISLIGRKGNLKQLKIIRNFEPRPYLELIEKPILMLFGENDPLVSPVWSIQRLNEIFPKGLPSFMEYYVASGEDHSFKLAPKCFSGSRKHFLYSETTRQKIVDWINSNAY
jgi:uncharacterized protein